MSVRKGQRGRDILRYIYVVNFWEPMYVRGKRIRRVSKYITPHVKVEILSLDEFPTVRHNTLRASRRVPGCGKWECIACSTTAKHS